MVALLHSNGQLRTERYGDERKDVKNLLYSRRLMTSIGQTDGQKCRWKGDKSCTAEIIFGRTLENRLPLKKFPCVFFVSVYSPYASL